VLGYRSLLAVGAGRRRKSIRHWSGSSGAPGSRRGPGCCTTFAPAGRRNWPPSFHCTSSSAGWAMPPERRGIRATVSLPIRAAARAAIRGAIRPVTEIVLSSAPQNAVQSAHVGGCHGLTAQSKTPVLTGVYANPDKRSQPLSRSEDGEDRSSTTPENPEKTALFESGAAECGAVAVDAANEAGIFHELSLVVDAWPSLNTEIRAALLAMVRTCLDRQSDASKSD